MSILSYMLEIFVLQNVGRKVSIYELLIFQLTIILFTLSKKPRP